MTNTAIVPLTDDRALAIELLTGPEAGRLFPLPTKAVRYGRGQDNEIVINHPTVSERHGIIQPIGDQTVRIIDFDSLNGVLLEGQRIANSLLAIGDIVQVGEIRVLIRSWSNQRADALFSIQPTRHLVQPHRVYREVFTLVVLDGADRGKTVPIPIGRHTIGRLPGNDIVLSDSSISNRHAVLSYSETGELRIDDCASRNGVSRNGRSKPSLRLKAGDIIQLGDVFLQLSQNTRIRRSPISDKLKKNLPLVTTYLLAGIVLVLALLTGRSESSAEKSRIVTARPAKASHDVRRMPKPSTHRQRVTRPSIARGLDKQPLLPPRPEEDVVHLVDRQSHRVELFEKLSRADAAIASRRYDVAHQLWNDILLIDSANETARSGLDRLEKIAHRLLEEALMQLQKDRAEAKRLCRLAQAISPTVSPIHQRAIKIQRQLG